MPDRFKLSEQVDKASGALTIGIVKSGESAVFRETIFSDGRVSLTAVDGGELSAEGALGDVLEAGAGFRVEAGSTWRFADVSEAEAFGRS